MKAYTKSKATINTGPRIFIPYKDITEEVLRSMDHLSVWGGSDKDTGFCLSWEFATRIFLAIKYLEKLGFIIEECSNKNHKKVWK